MHHGTPSSRLNESPTRLARILNLHFELVVLLVNIREVHEIESNRGEPGSGVSIFSLQSIQHYVKHLVNIYDFAQRALSAEHSSGNRSLDVLKQHA